MRLEKLLLTMIAVMSASLVLQIATLYHVVVSDGSQAALPMERLLEVPSDPLYLGSVPIRGDALVQVVIVEFIDYECPYCVAYTKDVYPHLLMEYVDAGRVRYASVNLPLDIHPTARNIAEMAVCADAQGAFWPVHDALLLRDDAPPIDVSIEAIDESGADAMAFLHCVEADLAVPVLEEQAETAAILEISATPRFLVGTLDVHDIFLPRFLIVGVQPLSVVEAGIEAFVDWE